MTEEVYGGPIVVQKIVKVEDRETAESLKAEVQALEGPAFIEAIQKKSKTTVSYANAGVSIDARNLLVKLIKPSCKATRRPGCDAELGNFGGFVRFGSGGVQVRRHNHHWCHGWRGYKALRSAPNKKA